MPMFSFIFISTFVVCGMGRMEQDIYSTIDDFQRIRNWTESRDEFRSHSTFTNLTESIRNDDGRKLVVSSQKFGWKPRSLMPQA